MPAPRPPLPEEWRDLPSLRSVYAFDQPGVRGVNAGALFETNSAGFRGPERSLEKPPGVFRIAVIGDSFAMGWGVKQEDTYAARIERTLTDRHPNRKIEVLNLGLAGQDTTAAVERLHVLGLPFDPDLVVVGFTVNDLENEFYRRTSVPLDVVARAIERSPLYLWRILAPRIAPLAEALWVTEGSYLQELDINYFENPKAWGHALSALERLAETAEQRGSCTLLLVHTRLHFLNRLHPYHRHYDAMASAAGERGFFVVPTLDRFLGHKDRDLWLLADDPHPGPEAHRLLAEALLEGIGDLPERCWSRPAR